MYASEVSTPNCSDIENKVDREIQKLRHRLENPKRPNVRTLDTELGLFTSLEYN